MFATADDRAPVPDGRHSAPYPDAVGTAVDGTLAGLVRAAGQITRRFPLAFRSGGQPR